jgi:S-methylmethionine-dependent homocysteine/selenocysteine methylase
MNELSKRLADSGLIILDGAISTEIQRRGVTLDEVSWASRATLEHPDIVREMHADYIRAGADVITANTYGAGSVVLKAAGMDDDQIDHVNRRAVELAIEGRELAGVERPVWIAGSLSSMPPLDGDQVTPRGPEAAAGYRRQGDVVTQAGVDLIITEMMVDIPNATIVTEAALATGLPVWHGFSAELSEDGETVVEWRENFFVYPLEPFAELVGTITAMGGEAAGIMHSYTPATTLALDVVRANWPGPVLAYAETGRLHGSDWVFDDVVSPDDYAAQMQLWVDAGVQIAGGCCGTNPDHIRRLRETLRPAA